MMTGPSAATIRIAPLSPTSPVEAAMASLTLPIAPNGLRVLREFFSDGVEFLARITRREHLFGDILDHPDHATVDDPIEGAKTMPRMKRVL